jgi:EVE domain-containing protein
VSYRLYAVSSTAKGRMEQMKVGDIAILYLTGYRKLIGALRVSSTMFEKSTRIWSGVRIYPWRIRLEPIAVVDPESAPSSTEILLRLLKGRSPQSWGMAMRGSIVPLLPTEGKLLLDYLLGQLSSSTVRPVTE